ncbi:hypothetical protein [Clostridium pasteurianum]|uniref:Uncharacterized protein n=1 Tax=Clostridium pasteurianum BC1 TaxID=86416 RepID=R4JZV2_CLOPA|nr:hypothetical protein [Clostridium pasteurianum]AGK95853.1 hypothetical protein Clopa_0829 [Clostridium pasteurianum BC1]
MYIIIFILCLVFSYGTAVVLDKTSNEEENKKEKESVKGKEL